MRNRFSKGLRRVRDVNGEGQDTLLEEEDQPLLALGPDGPLFLFKRQRIVYT